jgi:hypothetical protein
MSRGGKRLGAGRKSSWPSGCGREDTKLIRVPIALADELLEIARRMDAGEQVYFSELVEQKKPAEKVTLTTCSQPDVLTDEPQNLSLLDFASQGEIDFSDADEPLTLRDAAKLIGCASSTLQTWKSKFSLSELAAKTLTYSGDAQVALTFHDGKYYAKRIGNTI